VPAPSEPALPTAADDTPELECDCLLAGRCATPEAFEGRSETRNAQCRWEDRAAGRASCSRESRFRPAGPGTRWSSWGRSTVQFRHAGEKGWCWYHRASENALTEGAADDPPAVRQPTRAEAERIGAECGTRVRPARMPDGLLRLAAWAVYEPVDATPAQGECFYHKIRLLVAQPA
jgi:hypothetical protein